MSNEMTVVIDAHRKYLKGLPPVEAPQRWRHDDPPGLATDRPPTRGATDE